MLPWTASPAPRAPHAVSRCRARHQGGKQGQFKGTYTIERFVASGDKLYSVGTLKGKAGNKKVTKDNVRLPAASRIAAAGDRRRASQVPPLPRRRFRPVTPARSSPRPRADQPQPARPRVRTNQIQLRIDAVQGPGNLLGNLLCGITSILNPGAHAWRTRPWPSSPRFSTRCSRCRREPHNRVGGGAPCVFPSPRFVHRPCSCPASAQGGHGGRWRAPSSCTAVTPRTERLVVMRDDEAVTFELDRASGRGLSADGLSLGGRHRAFAC